jgi:flagellar basal-body rod protein FlgB
MSFNFDAALGIHADALRVRSQRAELLASNLANADTPNFKAKDIDFRQALDHAMDHSAPSKMKTTHQNHIPFTGGAGSSGQLAPVQYRTALQDSLDGNTVDEQIEQSQFMQNAVQYQASLQFLGGKFSGITKALKGE